MGDNLDTLAQITGFGGVADQAFRIGPETEAANKEQFGRAEGRQEDLRNRIVGDP